MTRNGLSSYKHDNSCFILSQIYNSAYFMTIIYHSSLFIIIIIIIILYLSIGL